ncbi:MAG TPA: asparagine synthase C-terminal domain-containing protein [Nitrososphaerales archaeon]|nr:asparagine synthase C-terminal domain-containing protein [Nitrososphaerales archaeon]
MSATGGFEVAAAELAERVDRSVARAVQGENMVAVAFSGGVDSSVLAVCAKKHARVVGCTGHTDKSGDGARARAVAAVLGIELVEEILTEDAVRAELSKVELPFEPSVMDRSLWCLYSLTAQKAAAGGALVMLLGQLADELFGGYAKYAHAPGAEGPGPESMMAEDLAAYRVRGRLRDVGACSRWVQARLPYEDAEVVAFAHSIPVAYKITPQARKAVFRRAAVILGVPEEVAGFPKKAAQYSSGIQKLVTAHAFNARG